MPEYATYQGARVQVLERFTSTLECRVCGGDGWLDHDGRGGDCEFCHGTGRETKPVEFAKVGLLEGAERGTTREVRASALKAADG
jgi:DnaJ-class molecular chaperone